MTTTEVTASDRNHARQLTKRIQAAADDLWALLEEAWSTKAHLALGYKSWGAYVAAEFDFSRRQSYRLVNQGDVIKQLRDAVVTNGSQLSEPIRVNEHTARVIKPMLPLVVEQIEAGVPVREAVQAARGSVTRSRFDDGWAGADDLPSRDVDEGCAHEFVCRHCGAEQ